MAYNLMRHAGFSHKLEQVYRIIEKIDPGPYLDLFGKTSRRGWKVFGNHMPDPES